MKQRKTNQKPAQSEPLAQPKYKPEAKANIGAALKRQASEQNQLKKKKTLHMSDFKKFKFMRGEDVEKRYSFGD
jgi:hypothetical protein